ncbi:MAG: deoxyribonuclease IV [Candidatus Aenigmarchaeota archaeon]|nr:deoxyribonuclease IV [Candidatus Aenigmarchaeota archaeon]
MRFGVHTSISGKIYKAVDRAKEIGCETMQIFTGNPRGWQSVFYKDEDLRFFRKKRKKAKIDPLFCHTAYLVNLASPYDKFYKNSVSSVVNSLKIAEILDAKAVVTHIGSHLGQGFKKGFLCVIKALEKILEISSSEIPIALENSAGAGGSIGSSLSEIKKILDLLKSNRLLVCIDTAHAFSAGYNLKTKKGLDEFLVEFDKLIGLKKLVLLHLNDSKVHLGSKIDRHENIGKGHIGLLGFRNIVNHPQLRCLPGILETPGFKADTKDKTNLELIRSLVIK